MTEKELFEAAETLDRLAFKAIQNINALRLKLAEKQQRALAKIPDDVPRSVQVEAEAEKQRRRAEEEKERQRQKVEQERREREEQEAAQRQKRKTGSLIGHGSDVRSSSPSLPPLSLPTKGWWEALSIEPMSEAVRLSEAPVSVARNFTWKLRNYSPHDPTPRLFVECVSQSSYFSSWQAAPLEPIGPGATSVLIIEIVAAEAGPQRFHFALSSGVCSERLNFILDFRAAVLPIDLGPAFQHKPFDVISDDDNYLEAELEPVFTRAIEAFPNLDEDLVRDYVINLRTTDLVLQALHDIMN